MSTGDGSFKAAALSLLGVLPRGEDWLSLDQVWTAADAYLVGVTSEEHAERLLRWLKRQGYVRDQDDPKDAEARQWQVTPSGADAGQPMTQATPAR